jgi:hypothetical protein
MSRLLKLGTLCLLLAAGVSLTVYGACAFVHIPAEVTCVLRTEEAAKDNAVTPNLGTYIKRAWYAATAVGGLCIVYGSSIGLVRSRQLGRPLQ